MCPSPNNSPIIISSAALLPQDRGLSIDSLDLSSFDNLFVVIAVAVATAAGRQAAADKFCEHIKLVPWLKVVIRSLYVTPFTFQLWLDYIFTLTS